MAWAGGEAAVATGGSFRASGLAVPALAGGADPRVGHQPMRPEHGLRGGQQDRPDDQDVEQDRDAHADAELRGR